jgi:hypothetical protein
MRCRVFKVGADFKTVEVGKVIFVNGILFVDPPGSVFLQDFIKDSFFMDGKEIRSDREPEEFIRNLHDAYNGSRFWVGPVEE